MKYLEQRVKELELEVKLLKAKNKLNDTSKYLNNYSSKVDCYKENTVSINLNSATDDSSFGNFLNSSIGINSWDEFDWSTAEDWISFDKNDSNPPYPDIIGSWDDNITNKDDMITTWGFESPYDKSDKDFLEYLNTNSKNNLNMKTYAEQNIEKTFGTKIVSKISVLHHCWEGDGYGYIIEKEGKKILILTNHGNPYVATVSDLYSKISEYKTVIQETERAIFVLK